MSNPERVEAGVMTFPAAGKALDVSPTTIRNWVGRGWLKEAFLTGDQYYRYVTVESVERLKREREGTHE